MTIADALPDHARETEQIACPFLRACTSTSIAFRPASSPHLAFPYTKDLKGST